jgi:hypothetical protein
MTRTPRQHDAQILKACIGKARRRDWCNHSCGKKKGTLCGAGIFFLSPPMDECVKSDGSDDGREEEEEDELTLTRLTIKATPTKSILAGPQRPASAPCRRTHQVSFRDAIEKYGAAASTLAPLPPPPPVKWHRPPSVQRARVLAAANAAHRLDMQRQRGLEALLTGKKQSTTPPSVPARALAGDAWDL